MFRLKSVTVFSTGQALGFELAFDNQSVVSFAKAVVANETVA